MALTDLGSRNGTRVNGDLVRGTERPLRSGDVVRIGAAEILVAEGAAASATRGGRLDAELERVRAQSASGVATLVRLRASADELAKMAPVLAGAAVVEAQDDGEHACLFSGDAGARVAELRRMAPAATIALAQAPADGATAAALWRKAASGSGPIERARPSLPSLPGVVVADEAMVRVFELVRKVAAAPTTVLILGETGVGKEVVAEQIHRQSPRAQGAASCGSTAARCPRRCSRPSCSATRRARSPAPTRASSATSKPPTAARCSSTRSASCRSTLQAKLLRVLENRRVHARRRARGDRRRRAHHRRHQPRPRRRGQGGALPRRSVLSDLGVRRSRAAAARAARRRSRSSPSSSRASSPQRLGAPPPIIRADAAAALARYAGRATCASCATRSSARIVLADGRRASALDDLPDSVRHADAAPPTGGDSRAARRSLELRRDRRGARGRGRQSDARGQAARPVAPRAHLQAREVRPQALTQLTGGV